MNTRNLQNSFFGYSFGFTYFFTVRLKRFG